jgi:TrmH family RNA methyltransferase
MFIDSPQNPRIQEAAKLHQAKYRRETGLILIEGPHPVAEAQAAGLTLHTVFTLDPPTTPQGVQVSERAMARLASTQSPPPVVAVAQAPTLTEPATLLAHPQALVLVLAGLQDPGNVGTLIRSACAFGATAVWLTPEGADPFQPKVIRSTAGLLFRLPVAVAPLPQQFPIPAWVASAHSGVPYRQASFSGPTVLLLGAEGPGLDILPDTQGLTIPMAEGVESLNVAVSGSLLLAEAAHQRGLQ